MKEASIPLDYDLTAHNLKERCLSMAADEMSAGTFLLHVISAPIHFSFVLYSTIPGFNNLLAALKKSLNPLQTIR
jgi:hypothetical protein